MTPGEFNELLAVSECLEPVTLADHCDRLAEILKLGFSALCCVWGGKEITPETFEPYRSLDDAAPSRPEYASPSAGAAWFGSLTGRTPQDGNRRGPGREPHGQ